MFRHLPPPILASLLAVLLSLGNAPAWWHCGDCDSGLATVTSVANRDSAAACRHGDCCRHFSSATTKLADPDSALDPVAESPADHPHDRSSCRLCHVAVAGTSATLGYQAVVIASDLPAITTDHAVSRRLLTTLFVVAPRGPPVA